MFSEQRLIFFPPFLSGYHLIAFIKTDNRNYLSLNFLLSLSLVELNFSWNNILLSCSIDFLYKSNKSFVQLYS